MYLLDSRYMRHKSSPLLAKLFTYWSWQVLWTRTQDLLVFIANEIEAYAQSLLKNIKTQTCQSDRFWSPLFRHLPDWITQVQSQQFNETEMIAMLLCGVFLRRKTPNSPITYAFPNARLLATELHIRMGWLHRLIMMKNAFTLSKLFLQAFSQLKLSISWDIPWLLPAITPPIRLLAICKRSSWVVLVSRRLWNCASDMRRIV